MKLILELVGLGFNGVIIALAILSQKIARTAMQDPTAGRLRVVQKYMNFTIVLACVLLVAQLTPVIQEHFGSRKQGASFSGNQNQNANVEGDNHGAINQTR